MTLAGFVWWKWTRTWTADMAEFVFAFMDCEFGGLDLEIHDISEVGLIPARRF